MVFRILGIFLVAAGALSLSLRADEGSKENPQAAQQKAEKKISDAISKLPAADQKIATAQRFCAVMPYSRLGDMGTPVKLTIEGKPVFVCCKSCVEEATKNGAATLKAAKGLTDASAALSKLPAGERAAIEAQKYCAVLNKNLLGSMGAPVKLTIEGKPVYLCCGGCTKKAESDNSGTLAKAAELVKAGKDEDHPEHK